MKDPFDIVGYYGQGPWGSFPIEEEINDLQEHVSYIRDKYGLYK